MKRIIIAGTVCLTVGLLTVASSARCDQVPEDSDDQKPTTRQNDDRLPPVMPGEEIVTETGQKMRVWSSAGPVPVNPQPTPQTFNGLNNNGNGAAIIIDGRRGHEKPGGF